MPRSLARAVLLVLLALSPAPLLAEDFKLDGNKLVLSSAVVYETGSDRLRPESDAALDQVKRYLDAKSYITLMRVEVHTDSSGSASANQPLSEKRSLAVARWLVSKGVDCKRLVPVGFGASKPVASNDTPEGKAQNRRTEFHNAALRGRAIGGAAADGGGMVAGDPCK